MLSAKFATWECACPSLEDACAHVAAAVIALQHAEQEGRSLVSGAQAMGRLVYRFARAPGGLTLMRVVVAGSEEHAFATRLKIVVDNRPGGISLAPTQRDWTIDGLLEAPYGGTVAPGLLARLFVALEDSSAAELDGKPVQISTEPVGIVGRVVDQNDGVRLYVEQDPAIDEVFANGAALCGDTLRPLRSMPLTAREREQLPKGLCFAPSAIAELVTEILPDLQKRIAVEIRTRRLPNTKAVPPRLVVETRREGERLVVLPSLVYGEPPTARIEEGRFVPLSDPLPLRDEAAEQRLARQLDASLKLTPSIAVELSGPEAVAFAKRLASWRGDLRGHGHQAFFLANPLSARVRFEGGELEVIFESEDPASGKRGRADADAVLRAWRAGESLVPLADEGWAPLPAEWLAQFGDRLADLLSARAANDGELPRCMAAEVANLAGDLDQEVPPDLRRLRDSIADFTAMPPAELPADLAATLRNYQRQGVDWLCFAREAGLGALLADDMGLGKTLQALCAIRGRTLVVAPTSVVQNWAEEIRRFRPQLRVHLHHGPKRALSPEAQVTLTTYAILRLDADLLAAQRWDTVVLDEAQNIKNVGSQVARAAFRLKADFRIALSGTPVENRLEELWSQFHFLNRGLLGTRADFAERYGRPIADGKPDAAGRLRERIRPFVLRRLKRDVAPELPPRTEVVLHCELAESERAVYDAVRAATVNDLVARLSAGGGVLEALEALLRLRQAACHPALVPGQQAQSSSKIEVLREALENVVADGHKALVFSQWTSLLDLIEPHLEQASIGFTRLDGSTQNRGAVVETFQRDEGPPVMLISLKAGGTGLNLTAADHVFLLDPWWNPAVEDQAADRAHRIGQERPVLIHRLVATDTVEERILALQEHKRQLADAALGQASQAAALTRDDLLALLAE
ncbi:MAG TPA: SNF2-related protein, partial [Terriglobales bacterium]|nr:SNF2-related protein [Terriglobales bacterium]